MSSSAMRFAVLTGMANPTPADAPEGDLMAELMPTSSPCEFSSGPPELPGLIAASVWMVSRIRNPLLRLQRPGETRNDARGEGPVEPEGVADGEHLHADAQGGGIAEGDRW